MTEAEWLASDDPGAMLHCVMYGFPKAGRNGLTSKAISDRKRRLFDVARIGLQSAALLREIVGNPFRPVCPMITESDVWICKCGVVFRSEGSSQSFSPCDCGRWEWRQRNELDDWLTHKDGTVLRMAQSIYESQDFAAMPILADALEDADCAYEDILRHCRQLDTPHAPGCFVLDLLLGKE